MKRVNPRHERPPQTGRWPGLLAFLWRLLISSEPRSTSFYADRQRRMKAAFWFLLGMAIGLTLHSLGSLDFLSSLHLSKMKP